MLVFWGEMMAPYGAADPDGVEEYFTGRDGHRRGDAPFSAAFAELLVGSGIIALVFGNRFARTNR